MGCEPAHELSPDRTGGRGHRAGDSTRTNMPANDPNTESDPLGPTEPGEHDVSDPIAQMLERTRGDELDFDAEFEQQRLLQKLFNRSPQETSIGRFVIRERLGSGGMGEVYRAWDPKLDRNVALKLLRANLQVETSSIILDEAKALAKVEHDNVVRVYDVEVHDNRPYYTMEVIEGQTLAQWMAQRRGLKAVVALFVRAGRGLQAIHAAGLVHGDFKPRNVLVGADGRVRVADFGLAASIGTSAGFGATDIDLRRPAGTLAYLAPEQFSGAPPSPASDQFSFCVALFEAVYGTLPFPRRDTQEIRDFIEIGDPQFPPASERVVPRWMRDLLARGLARDPRSRYPGMGVLLDELGRDRDAARRRNFGIAAGFIAVATAGLAWFFWPPSPTPTPEPDPLAAVWNEGRRAKLEEVFSAVHEPWAQGSRETVTADLDRWSDQWRKHWDHAPSDLEKNCLITQRYEVMVFVDQLEVAERKLLLAAPQLTAEILDPDHCIHSTLPVAVDDETRTELTQMLARAVVERVEGDYEPAAELVEQVRVGAREQNDVSLEIDALSERARIRVGQGRRADAVADLRVALDLARTTVPIDSRRSTRINTELVWAADETIPAEQRYKWIGQAEASLDYLGESNDKRLAKLRLDLVDALESAHGKPAEAEVKMRRVISDLEGYDMGNSLLAMQAHHELANLISEERLTQRDDADAEFKRAIEIAEAIWGTGHLEIAKLLSDRGGYALDRGEMDRAREDLTASLSLREKELIPPHPLLARSHIRLAKYEYLAGHFEQANVHADAAIANLPDELDRDWRAQVWLVKGQIAASEGNDVLAEKYFRESLAAASPGQTWDLALAQVELAGALFRQAQCMEANEYFGKSVPVLEDEIYRGSFDQLFIVWHHYIWSLSECGEHERAKREVDRVSPHLDELQKKKLLERLR